MVMPTNLYPPLGGGGSTPTGTASVATRHADYLDHLPAWCRTDAVLAGLDGVKKIATQLLPMSEYDERHPKQYWAFVERANFVNFTLHTANKLEGLIFRQEPSVKVPAQFEKRLNNINNKGDSFYSFSKKVTNAVIRHGRAGIFVDYPGEVARNSADPLKNYPYLSLYDAHSIINWREANIDGAMTLDQVVLMEVYQHPLDFGSKPKVRFKVLELDENGLYRARIFEQRENGDYVEASRIYPGKNTGMGVRKIPFVFINPVDTSPTIYRSPILDMVDLNISHYRSSASLEAALHILAKPTVLISGLAADEAAVFELGGVWRLPADADAKYLEMQAEGLAGLERAMNDKQKQMMEIGMQMLSSASDGPETAQAARIRQHGQTSLLSSIAGSTSTGLQDGLQIACDMDSISGKCNVELNQNYTDTTMEYQMFAELNRALDGGFISAEDHAWNMIQREMVRPGQTIEQVVSTLKKQREEQPPRLLGNPILAAAAEAVPAGQRGRNREKNRNGQAVGQAVAEDDKPPPARTR